MKTTLKLMAFDITTLFILKQDIQLVVCAVLQWLQIALQEWTLSQLAFFVLGVKEGLALAESMPSVEALFIDDMGAISKTCGFHLEQIDSKPTM